MRIAESGFPYPVSASTITGSGVAAVTSRAVCVISVWVRYPKSGAASRAADTEYPETNSTSNPACVASLADRASYTPGMTTVVPAPSRSRIACAPVTPLGVPTPGCCPLPPRPRRLMRLRLQALWAAGPPDRPGGRSGGR